MDFLEVLDVFSNLPSGRAQNSKKKQRRPKVFILFYVLLIPATIWLTLELNSIFNLLSPILFLLLFTTLGLILTMGTIFLIYKLNLIEEIQGRGFFEILIPITLLTVSAASFVNRNYVVSKYESFVKISDPERGANIARVLITLDGEEIRLRVPESIGDSLQIWDSLLVEKKKGLLGFDIVSIKVGAR